MDKIVKWNSPRNNSQLVLMCSEHNKMRNESREMVGEYVRTVNEIQPEISLKC